MEPLRIRIPDIHYCSVEDCVRLTRNSVCKHCVFKTFSDPRMRQEMSPATLPRQSKVIHSPPLRRFLSG
jgi:hypothetical protein